MAYRNLINRLVEQTFDNYLKDLTVDVTLNQKDAASYDFNTGEVKETSGGVSTVKGALIQTTKRSEDGIPVRTSNILIIKSSDIDTPSVYDSLTIGTRKYRIDSYTDNGYAVELNISGA